MTDKTQELQAAEAQATELLQQMVHQMHVAATLVVSHDDRTHKELAEALGVTVQDLSLFVSSNHDRLSLKKAFGLALRLGLDPVPTLDGVRLSSEGQIEEGAAPNETLRVALGALLGREMEARKIKGAQLARMAGVSPVRVSLSLSTDRHMKVSPERVLQLLALLDVRPKLGVDVRLPVEILMARLVDRADLAA
jgi:transcriptional regulator with XRE-family HTH domain